MLQVNVVNLGRILEARSGENILEVLQREGMEIDAYCGGFGSCGKCQVQVLRGLVSKPTSQEIKHLKERTQEGYHLACQAILVEDVDIDISASLARQIPVLVESGEAWLEEPPVSRTELVVHKPMLSERCSLQRTVEQNLGGEKPSDWTLRALEGLSRLEDRDELRFEVVSDKGGVRWFNPVSQDHSFLGVAIDIGTTTVACELLDLANGVSLQRTGSLNRQATFGADVVSRLRTIQDNHGTLVTLQELVISTINDLIQEGCQKAGKDPGRIFAVTFAGNTIMEHILLGVSPLSIGVAPYVPVFCRSYIISAQLLHLVVNPHAQVFIFPSVAGYVGGDIVAGMAAHGLDEKNGILLYVDIGTNGEIALVDHGTIYCCGTAAGPAFEGAQIKHGTRATLGAISSVEVEDGQLKIYTIGDTAPRGVCGTGLIDALSCLVKEGLISPNGRLQKNGQSLASRLTDDGKVRNFVLSYDPEVVITQEDIAQLQLAKAALQAGRMVLLQEAGRREEEIDGVVLAGAFGSFINPESAMTIGIIPRVPSVKSVGNASLLGAKKALLSREFRERVEILSQHALYVELSARGDFQDYFYESLLF